MKRLAGIRAEIDALVVALEVEENGRGGDL
jgi:hypothetical protein